MWVYYDTIIAAIIAWIFAILSYLLTPTTQDYRNVITKILIKIMNKICHLL